MRVVFDTNVVVSALLFTQGSMSWFRTHWRNARVTPLASRATVDELIRVLSYPKFKLDRSEIQALLADYLPYVEAVGVKADAESPRCADIDDQMFVDLAIQGQAGVLVSGDAALLAMARQLPILTPAQYRRKFGASR